MLAKHEVSSEDAAFPLAFETGQVPPAQFDHRAHVRLAYVYLVERDPDATEDLIARYPELLDSKIMLTHYSASVLFSAEARGAFMEPDASPIPRY